MDDREVVIAAAKKRMAAFRLRPASSASATSSTDVLPTKTHARSHSRNNSTSAFPLSTSSSTNVPTIDDLPEIPGSVPSSPSPRSRPNSHHRRRSSVSTRRESAEMMGVTLPESSSEITADANPMETRRLALWALEGKNSRTDNAFIGSFTKVEIPELDTSESFEGNFEAIQQPKPKSTFGSFSLGNTLVGKRDSFGKLLLPSSSSLKDQLHTLLEEEEDEEEERTRGAEDSQNEMKIEHNKDTTLFQSKSDNFFQDVSNIRSEPPFRIEAPRPSTFVPPRLRPNLTLRPLSLTPESLPINRSEGLPTPSLTPSPRIGGLRALTLAPSPSPAPSTSSSSSGASGVISRRQSLSVSPSPGDPDRLKHRMSLGSNSSPSPSIPFRKSSISYKRTSSGDSIGYLPTPGPTPTATMPPSLNSQKPVNTHLPSGAIAELERPLSPTEQAFLFRSHTSLLCRISDLEKAIADGGGRLPPGAGVPNAEFSMEALSTRPSADDSTSSASATSTSITEPEAVPSDEMLRLVADLKAERDELMRDAAQWRARVADMEHQIGTLNRRVEAERREAWVVRERLGTEEVEKKRVREEMERVQLEYCKLEKSLQAEAEGRTRAEAAHKTECARREEVEREVQVLRGEIQSLRAQVEQSDADLHALLVTPKIDVRMQMRRLNSVDSGTSGSSTDVEEYVPFGMRSRKLNAVVEEEERDLPYDVTSEDGSGSEIGEDELAHYEDDDGIDDDMIFCDDQTSSSFGSVVRSNSHLMRLDLPAVAPLTSNAPLHAKKGSMERGWSFPAQSGSSTRVPQKADPFFECLDALDESDAEPEGQLPTYDSATAKQFWRAATQETEGDEMPPFVLPAQPRKEKEWKEVEAAKLEVVVEVEEADSPLASSTVENTREGVDSDAEIVKAEPVTPRSKENTLPPVNVSTKKHQLRRTSKDLAIPGFKPYIGSVPVLKAPPPPRKFTPPGSSSTPLSATTETKQASPTQIPQPSRSSPSLLTTPPRPRASLASPTFIPRSPSSKSSTPSTPTKSPMSTAPKGISSTPPLKITKPPSAPVFTQPRLSVTRSSILPHSTEPHEFTRHTIPQQNAGSRAQSLTAKLSLQMQTLTTLWTPWGSNTSASQERESEWHMKKYAGKGQQLERLRIRLQREGAQMTPYVRCACCRDSGIDI